MTSLRQTKSDALSPVKNGQQILFFVQKDYIIPPQTSINISLGHSLNNVKSGYCLQLDSSADSIRLGLMAQKKIYSNQTNQGEQLMAFLRNTSDNYVKIQKGFNIVKGILKAFGIDLLQILPFLASQKQKKLIVL